ncbi:hypothetical protein [Wenyingzhuangia sp. IMCC45467]
MKRITWFFLAFISCYRNDDNPCEELNESYIIKLNKARTSNQKEQNLMVLDEWIKEIRSYDCSPQTYYQHYDKIVNQD